MAEPESELNTPSSIKVISFSTDVESQSSDGNWAAEAKTTDGGDVEEKPTKTRRWSNIAQGHTLKTAGESIIAGINLSDAMGGGNTAQRPPSSARRTAATESTQLEPVYFGDVVCFGALMGGSNHDGWLRAEGLMVDRVELSRSGSRGQNATNFDFCQFRICPALQHEASDELARVSSRPLSPWWRAAVSRRLVAPPAPPRASVRARARLRHRPSPRRPQPRARAPRRAVVSAGVPS